MRTARRHIRPIYAVLLVLVAGCPHRPDSASNRARSATVRVRSYTEATPVRAVTGVMPYAFTATPRGLDRWDLRSGQGLQLTGDHGLPGDDVLATALDRARGWLWVATDGGVTRYDVENGVFTGVPPAPTDSMAELVRGVRALAPAGAGGVWLGSVEGLAYTDTGGGWEAYDFHHPITTLVRDRAGNLWVGTEGNGIVVRRADGVFESFASDEHCVVRTVRHAVVLPDGGLLAVGEDVMGEQRISLIREGACASFRASPNARWVGLTARGDEIVVMTRRKLYALSQVRRGARRLRRDGMRLVPLAAGTDTKRSGSPYLVRSLEPRVPFGASSLAAVGDALLIGTTDLGTAIVDRARVSWLRRGELVGGGERISVACTGPKRCFVATGGRGVWQFDGATFRRVGDDEPIVLAVTRGAHDEVFALYRLSDEPRVRIARIDGPEWQELENIEIMTPGRRASLAFAATSPRGMLWVGLEYLDDDGEERSFGAAEIDVGLELVAYHHASFDEAEQERGVLPIPISVNGVAFHGRDEIWLSSNEGIVRIKGQTLRVYMESEGLVSELARDVAITSGGVVFAATGVGVGVYDGEHWSAPAPLRRAVNAIDVGADGHLWMATSRGVAAYDGAKVRRLDERRGLLEDDTTDLTIDRYGRVWALSRAGISVVTP